jgi:hypothetical protein
MIEMIAMRMKMRIDSALASP